MTRSTPGQCRFCKCTEANACKLPTGDPCSWYVSTRDVCNAPGCIRAFHALEKRESRAALQRMRKPTPGTIHQRMMAERQARRRAQRAKAKTNKPRGAA